MGNSLIYILTSEAMPRFIKIGATTRDVNSRIRELNAQSGSPGDYQAYAVYETNNPSLVDTVLHSALDTLLPDARYSPKKELYEIAPEKVYALLEAMSIIDGRHDKLYKGPPAQIISRSVVQPSEQPLQPHTVKTPNTTFAMLGIPCGETLYFKHRTIGNVYSYVVADQVNQVTYNGQNYSLNDLLHMILALEGQDTTSSGNRKSINAWEKFTYNGVVLTVLRKRISIAR